MKHPELAKEIIKHWNNIEEKTPEAFTNILIDIGATEKDKEDVFEIIENDTGIPKDLGCPAAELWYQFMIKKRESLEQQKNQVNKITIDTKIDNIKKIIEEYDNNKNKLSSTSDFKEPVEDLTGAIEQLNSIVNPSKIDFDSLLIPKTREAFIKQIKNKPEALETSYKINGDSLKFQTGAFSIIAAPTGHGKTSFLLNLLVDAAKRYPEQKHWLFSYEEDDTAILLKTLNTFCDEKYGENNKGTIESYYRTGGTSLFKSNKSKSFKKKEFDFWELIKQGTINIIHADYPVEDLMQAIKTVATDKAGLIAIDYIQLLYKENKNKYLSRPEELKHICLDLKDVAIETKKPIVAAAQFNREVQSPDRMIPQRISDASDIEKASNKIIGLWNGDKKENDLFAKKGQMYLKILKARDEQSDISARYEWDGNKGVVKNYNFANKDIEPEIDADNDENIDNDEFDKWNRYGK